MRKGTNATPLRGLALCVCMVAIFGSGGAQAGTSRFEVASGFHQADPLFGAQLTVLMGKLKALQLDGVRLRTSRKALGASSRQMIELMALGSLDGALLDPITLGYQPAIAQIFGGLPFGPKPERIVNWSASPAGRRQVIAEFETIGVHPIICGHSRLRSGVFARQAYVLSADSHQSTVHTKGLAQDTYQALGFLTRQIPGADLYMGYATGVADFLVSLNPAMDARAGFGQVSAYFYYPSWERSSAFAVLLIGLKPWQSFSSETRESIQTACASLNQRSAQSKLESTLQDIENQGSANTIVRPWPEPFTSDAYAQWRQSAMRLLNQHPSLAPAFEALDIPSQPMPADQTD